MKVKNRYDYLVDSLCYFITPKDNREFSVLAGWPGAVCESSFLLKKVALAVIYASASSSLHSDRSLQPGASAVRECV